MSMYFWMGLVLCLSGAFALVNIIKILIKQRSLTFVFLLSSVVAFIAGSSSLFFPELSNDFPEWSWLVSSVLLICGLFGLVRESKPVFARFPIYLTFLPLLSIIFYPLAVDALVIKNLILATYQAGALVVALLLFSVKQKKEGEHILTLAAIIVCIVSYLFEWFFTFSDINTDLVAKLGLAAGIILASFGLRRKYT